MFPCIFGHRKKKEKRKKKKEKEEHRRHLCGQSHEPVCKKQ
jgi:hypothetical protein